MLPIYPLLLFIAGFALLVKGAELFVKGGVGLAGRLALSKTLIGFTIISFGTTLPELAVSVNAVIIDTPDMIIGNVLGSTIANIALILSLAALVRPDAIRRSAQPPYTTEWGFMFAGALLFSILALRGRMDAYSGVILLAAFGCILWRLWVNRVPPISVQMDPGGYHAITLIAGIAGIIIGSYLLVNSAVTIATATGISEFVIGITLVAVGTSLPELATSLIAVVRGEGEISLGNILGANIFNLLFIMGVVSLIRPIPIVSSSGVVVMVVFSLLVLPFFMLEANRTRIWAGILLTFYGLYIASLFGLLPTG
jgi:cation:H+ antiporter